MNVLLIEDQDENFEAMCGVLAEGENKVIHARNGQEARLKIQNQQFDFIIMSLDIKGLAPFEFVRGIRQQEVRKNLKERVPILVNGSDSKDFQRELSKEDNVQFMERPFTALDFKKKITSFDKKTTIKKENTKQVKAGEYLIQEGDAQKQMFWVLDGSFTITKRNSDGKNVIVGEAKSGELLGEMSFLDNLPRSASVKAKEDSEVLVIPYKKFMDVVDDQPRWFRSLMATLSQRLRDADERLAKKFVKEDN